MDTPLSEWTDVSDVDNVVIFVSDALRFDFLPEEVRNLGVTARAIAPSTFTASALPSLLTGMYPATHKVWMFDDRLAESAELLRADGVDVGFNAESVWIGLESDEKPPLQIHHLETESKLGELEPPFVHVVHDVGPHAPYGFGNEAFESTEEFFREYESRRSRLIDLYRQDCHNSAERFLDVYDQLAERDLLDETLVVFTSDHGQCLGEQRNGGRFGHGHPMCPETVEIPIVFLGAGLPKDETYPSLLSGTDVAPTVLSAQRGAAPDGVDGVDVWREGSDPSRKPRSDVWQHLEVEARGLSTELSVYAASGVWNATGGHVLHRKSSVQRLGALLYDNLFRGYSPAWRDNASPRKVASLVRLSLARTLTFGDPDFTTADASALVPDEFEEGAHQFADTTLNEDQESLLRDLGYLK
ncbi:sulfatase-like hydrolase/transferase [Halorarum halophilum]|uniref:Sulfatase-like hydrolase/transferase n=1 Tax=Halorarum halophilum TaxID=2743090 RepID=A0A7D5GGK4_9EURY|nr:sulfatase-like hydrolase/transferase [Halobaculum halophilum]QLG29208.1 sulfatase-like hydrolase/transferase [Halobaculum halophilum]